MSRQRTSDYPRARGSDVTVSRNFAMAAPKAASHRAKRDSRLADRWMHAASSASAYRARKCVARLNAHVGADTSFGGFIVLQKDNGRLQFSLSMSPCHRNTSPYRARSAGEEA